MRRGPAGTSALALAALVSTMATPGHERGMRLVAARQELRGGKWERPLLFFSTQLSTILVRCDSARELWHEP